MKDSIRESMIYGYMLEPIQEGLIFNNPHRLLKKLERVVDKYSKDEITFFGPEHYMRKIEEQIDKLSEDEKKKYKELKKKLMEIDAGKERARMERKLKSYKDYWDNGNSRQALWEGDFIAFIVTDLGYTEEQVIKHYTKIKDKLNYTISDQIKDMTGDDNEKAIENATKLGLKLEYKIIPLYDNDDDSWFYCFDTKKSYAMYSDDSIEVVSSIFKTVFDDWDWNEVYKDTIPYKESELYKKYKVDFPI